MKTTLEIPDHLFRRAKAAAALRGQTLKELMTRALKKELDENQQGPRPDTIEQSLKELKTIAAANSKAWRSNMTAAEAIREQRRG